MNILNQLGANPQSIWHTAKNQKPNGLQRAQWLPADKEDDAECLEEALRAAVDEYTDKVLRGLNAMTKEEKADKIAEFEAIHRPHNETPENMAEFARKVQAFKAALARLKEIEHNEMLIKPAMAAEEEVESIASFVRSQILAGSPRQIR